jgi:hypothetical protein
MSKTKTCGSKKAAVKGSESNKDLERTAKRKLFTPRPADPKAKLGWIWGRYGIQTVEIVGPAHADQVRVRPRILLGKVVVTERMMTLANYQVFPTVAAAKKAATTRLRRCIKEYQTELKEVKEFKPRKVA